MTIDETILEEARAVRERMLELQRDAERVRADFNHAVRRLHAAGGSLREIADCLGISHQRVHQIVEGESDEPTPLQAIRRRRRRRTPTPPGDRFRRFAEEARATIVEAQTQARELGHDYVGTEHLLLGLLREGATAASRALAGLGATQEGVRERVLSVVGRGNADPKGAMPFTPRSKRVLELALREALKSGANEIGSEHLLLALVDEGEGVAATILAELGADEAAVRRALAG